MSAKIFYNGFEFSAGKSRPWLGVKRDFLADSSGAPPQKANVEYTVKVWFLEPSFADNQARYRSLVEAMQTTEGVLRMVDENAAEILNVRVRSGVNALPQQWGEHLAEVEVAFRATEDVTAGASASDLTYAPAAGTGPTVTLPNVVRFNSNHTANRYSPHLPNRRETLGVISAMGRKQANPRDDLATRRAFLMAEKQTLETAMDSKEGVLAYLGESRTVKIEKLEVVVDDASEELTWTLQAGYQRFPAGDYTECDFVVTQRDNTDRSERLTGVAGKVRADDEAGALAKVTSLKQAYSVGRMFMRGHAGTPRLEGQDGATFVEVDFTHEYREALAVLSYQLEVDTRVDTKSGQMVTSYRGMVTSNTSTAALTKARTWSAVLPIRLQSAETIGVVSVAGATEQTVQVGFAYEYLSKGVGQWAEVTSTQDNQLFGANTRTVSGTATADTKANALALARSFKPTGLMRRMENESDEQVKKDTTALFVKVTFTYAYHADPLAGAISYGVKTSEDITTRRRTITYSGVAYGLTATVADGLINNVVADEQGEKMVDERESQMDATGSDNKFKSRSFTITFRGTMVNGLDDILEAQWSVETTYSIDRAILTPIPFGVAHVQTGCGLTIGRRRVSGRMVCLNEGTAVAWARAKQPTLGYREDGDAPRERTGRDYYDLSGVLIRAVTFEFEYGMCYPNLQVA